VAFPGTYNFNYYRGDTYEFKIYPKTADGSTFSLSGFDAAFTISPARGSASRTVAYAQKSSDNTHIVCAITPDMTLPAGGSLVYDVEIRKQQDTPYSLVFTLVTGTISITDQVTLIPLTPPVLPPGNPVNLSITSRSQTGATLNWEAPTTGGAVSSYTVGVAAASAPNTIIATATKLASEFTHQFTGLQANTSYVFGVSAINVASPATPAVVTITASTLPTAPTIPTDFAVPLVTDTEITVTWDEPTSANQTGYVARLDGNNVSSLLPPESTTYTFQNLTPGTSYVVGIVASNDGGASPIASQTVVTQES
jgi:hypothetical protein